MRRRLDLASALVHEPSVLFLDEPTTGLDPVSRQTIWEEVQKLNDEGTTVFLTTQYLEEADQLADRVGIIDFGRIVAEDTPDRLKAADRRPHLEVKLMDGAVGAGRRRSSPGSASRCRAGTAPSWSSSSEARREVAPVVRALDEAGLDAWRRSTWSSRASTTCSWPRPGTTSSPRRPRRTEEPE